MQEHHLVAYVEDENSREAVSQALKELLFTNFQVFSGSAAIATKNLIKMGNPKLLIVDVSSSKLPLSDINELAEVCEAGTKVIVIGVRNDVSLFRELMQMGICDYLVKPISLGLVKKSLLNVFENREIPKTTTRLSKQVAVIGVKGGVGASTIASSLGHYLSDATKRKVLLLDLNTCMGDIAIYNDTVPSKELGTYLFNNKAIDTVLYERFVNKVSDYLYIASPQVDIGQSDNIIGEVLENFIENIKSKFHYIIVDTPVSLINTGKIKNLSPYHNIFVLSPDISCLKNLDIITTSSLILKGSLQKTFVLNKFGESKVGQLDVGVFSKLLGNDIDVVLPYDSVHCIKGANNGNIKQIYGGKIGKGIQKLGEIVSGNNKAPKTSFFERILSGI